VLPVAEKTPQSFWVLVFWILDLELSSFKSKKTSKMTVSPDDLRPRWWTVIVVILDILLPSIMVTGFFLVPETMFLEEYIQDPLLSTMFRYIARSNASGDALVILICCFEVTTKDLAILKVCNTVMLFSLYWEIYVPST
jgi:hypothetical protein